jgi:hypothetical protein
MYADDEWKALSLPLLPLLLQYCQSGVTAQVVLDPMYRMYSLLTPLIP